MNTKKNKLKKELKDIVFDRDAYRCKLCDDGSCSLYLYHITSIEEMPEGEFLPENCLTLCLPCRQELTLKKQPKNKKPIKTAHANIVYDPVHTYPQNELYETIGMSSDRVQLLVYLKSLRQSSESSGIKKSVLEGQ